MTEIGDDRRGGGCFKSQDGMMVFVEAKMEALEFRVSHLILLERVVKLYFLRHI